MSEATKPTVFTRVARAGYEEHRFFSWGVFGELTGRETLSGLVAMAVSGRRLDPGEVAMLDDIAAVLTVADPRIWPLKVGRLAASYGGALEGLAAGILSLDCLYVGGYRTTPTAARMLLELAARLGPDVEDPAERPAVGVLDRSARRGGSARPAAVDQADHRLRRALP